MTAHYYADDLVTIYHGDALEVMDALSAGVADIVITSPKYNMGLTPGGNGRGLYGHTTQHASRFTTDGYDGDSDAMDPDEYDAWIEDALVGCARATAGERPGAVWWNHRPRVKHGRAWLPFNNLSLDFLKDPTEDRFGLRQIVPWDRRLGTGTNASHLSMRQEWVMLFCWDGFEMNRLLTASGDVWWVDGDGEPCEEGDGVTIAAPRVWPFSPPADKHGHPCPFPIEIPERCIRLSSPSTVLDPFMGVGTTLIAAKRAGVKAIGIDLSERFCEIAAERCGGPVRSVSGGFDFGEAS